MLDRKLENKIKKHAEEIFGQGKNPPAGHRVRFEQRLKEQQKVRMQNERNTRRLPIKKYVLRVAAVAALLAGLLWGWQQKTDESAYPDVAEVRNFYHIQLEEQVDATKQLVQMIDGKHRDALLAHVEHIEKDPIPEVQLPDDEYIVLLADVYSQKIESLQHIQHIIKENN